MASGKPVALIGDYNVIPTPRDVYKPERWTEDALFRTETREAFGRPAEPWEVANVMVFLASDYASYMTGEVVSVSSQHP